MLDAGADQIGKAAVGIDMVGTILGIILDDDDQRVLARGRVGDDLGDAADRIVIVGDLAVGGVDPIDRLGKIAEMIVREAE